MTVNRTTHPTSEQIDAELQARARPERAAKEKAYLKSEIAHYGCDAAALRAAVKVAKIDTREALVGTVRALWKVPVFERRAAAALLLQKKQKLLVAEDLPLVEDLLRASKTWALVDAISVHVVGPLIEREPKLGRTLDRWAKDDDFWIRRAAMLALLGGLGKGGGDWERFARYADAMLDEKEFFIRKAIGWILRARSRKEPAQVAAWLLPRAARASGVTIREAVKYLPARDRDAITRARA